MYTSLLRCQFHLERKCMDELFLLFILGEGAIYGSLHIIGSQIKKKLTHTFREITTHIFRSDKKELIQKVQKPKASHYFTLLHAVIQKMCRLRTIKRDAHVCGMF